MIPVVGVGGGGHARVVIDILRRQGVYDPVGVLTADPQTWGGAVLGVPVLGGDDLLAGLPARGVGHVFLGFAGVRLFPARIRLAARVRELGLRVVTAVHPAAAVAGSAVVGDGATVMPAAVVGPAARLGADVIVNSGAVVEHDCDLGDHAHVAPGAVLGGGVRVGPGAHVGLGARV
ncbi:MAG: hypothetical protein K2X82_10690, partial [Gemmataceae bacterium]|nr:hypothetical protein [Gemmataceae bacterium]